MAADTARTELNSVPAAGGARFSGKRMFAAFRHRKYRLYFTGQLISQIGTLMHQAVQVWLMYNFTGSLSP